MAMEILAASFDEYRDKYDHVQFTRDEQGVLVMRFHTDRKSVV